MKIKHNPQKYEIVSVEPCCKSFQELRKLFIIIYIDDYYGEIKEGPSVSMVFGYYDKADKKFDGNYGINYCPFCGEKIEYENINN